MGQVQSTSTSVSFGQRAQNANHSDRPGSYQLVVRARNVEVNPDDVTELEVYITGYGHIETQSCVLSFSRFHRYEVVQSRL
jgi:hypothetical protein